jgi:hypothetical protein
MCSWLAAFLRDGANALQLLAGRQRKKRDGFLPI